MSFFATNGPMFFIILRHYYNQFFSFSFLIRPKTPWLMLFSRPVMTATCSESSTRRSRRPSLSCSAQCLRPTARWLSGEPNTRLTPFSALRSWRRLSNEQSYNHIVSTCDDSVIKHETYSTHALTGKSLPSVFRMQRSLSRL